MMEYMITSKDVLTLISERNQLTEDLKNLLLTIETLGSIKGEKARELYNRIVELNQRIIREKRKIPVLDNYVIPFLFPQDNQELENLKDSMNLEYSLKRLDLEIRELNPDLAKILNLERLNPELKEERERLEAELKSMQTQKLETEKRISELAEKKEEIKRQRIEAERKLKEEKEKENEKKLSPLHAKRLKTRKELIEKTKEVCEKIQSEIESWLEIDAKFRQNEYSWEKTKELLKSTADRFESETMENLKEYGDTSGIFGFAESIIWRTYTTFLGLINSYNAHAKKKIPGKILKLWKEGG